MTEKEANKILQEKYPQGYIRYSDIGSKANTNRVILVSFTAHGKDYRYEGGFESVLVRLGCMKPTPMPERSYNLEDNIFFQKNWK